MANDPVEDTRTIAQLKFDKTHCMVGSQLVGFLQKFNSNWRNWLLEGIEPEDPRIEKYALLEAATLKLAEALKTDEDYVNGFCTEVSNAANEATTRT